MGITYVEGTVRGPQGEARARLLVDSGATYSLLPDAVWRAIGIEPIREVDFALADGTIVHRWVSECRFELAQGAAYSPVVLGESGDDQALLGVVTLENLGLVFNPFSRTLQPMRMQLV
jgi:predicted aspartyl protease